MKIMSKKMFGSKILLLAKQWPCKESKFDTVMAPGEVPGETNKQYHSKELEQGFSVLFFSFGTALVIEKIGFENFPSYPY